MAPKRSTPLEDPPAASSSEEEEEEEEETSSGEDEGSSEEEEEQQTQTLTSKKPDSTTKKPESESESGSESDDDEKPKKVSDSTVKPIASKPMEEAAAKTTKARSKPAAKSTTAALTSPKRGSEVERDPKDAKRAKKKDSETDGLAVSAGEKSEDTKKQLFQRLWSEDDEIALLKGIIDFIEKKGVDPTKDMVSFFEYIKKSLHFDVSLTQLKDKVWRLKKKFENHVKGKKGEDKTFSKAHDQKTFDLSKKIWGVDGTIGGLDSSAKSNGKAKKSANSNNSSKISALKAELGLDVDKESEKVDKMVVEVESSSGLKQFDKTVSVTGLEDYVVKRGLDMLEGAKRMEMEEKWRKLHVAELELFLKRNELIREQAKLMLASYKE